MKLNVIGTGSSGNAYLLEAGDSMLLLDAGIQYKRIIKAVKQPSKVAACLVTHEHKDHAKSVCELAGYGIPIVMSKGTVEALDVNCPQTGLIYAQTLSAITLGQFTVVPFETQHDAAEPLGFVVRHDPTGETLLYATDTYYLSYTFPGIHYWIVECNYIDGIINQQMQDGELSQKLRTRLLRSHMSLRRLIEALKANDLSKTRAIVLVHLSDQRSDEAYMVDIVRRETGIDNVIAAQPNTEIQLDLNPF